MVESNRKYRPIIVLFGKSKTDFDFPKKSNHLLNLQPPTFPVKKREMQAVESFIYFANGGECRDLLPYRRKILFWFQSVVLKCRRPGNLLRMDCRIFAPSIFLLPLFY